MSAALGRAVLATHTTHHMDTVMTSTYSAPRDALRIKNNRLNGSEIVHVTSPNSSGEFLQGQPDTLVIHFTGGSSASSSVDYMLNPDSKVSAHLVIGRNGEVTQLLPFNVIAWHAGQSSFADREQLNNYAIGIELDNAGPLDKDENGEFVSWFGKRYHPDDVFIENSHSNSKSRFGANNTSDVQENPNAHPSLFWHRYSEVQLQRTFDLCRLLCNTYHINYVLGHEEISPGRKFDPGPAFPLRQLRRYLTQQSFNAQPSDFAVDELSRKLPPSLQFTNDKPLTVSRKPITAPQDFPYTSAIVSVKRLNVRFGPGTEFTKASSQLTSGQVVKVVERNDTWSRVAYTAEGWVSNEYLTFVKQKR